MTITKEQAYKIKDSLYMPRGAGPHEGAGRLFRALDAAGAFDTPKPVLAMTRAKAVAVLSAVPIRGYTGALDAIDRAGAFQSEAALAEIDAVASEILAFAKFLGRDGFERGSAIDLALRLANACRDAGLVKP